MYFTSYLPNRWAAILLLTNLSQNANMSQSPEGNKLEVLRGFLPYVFCELR